MDDIVPGGAGAFDPGSFVEYGMLADHMDLHAAVDAGGTVKYVEYVKEVTNEPNYDAAVAAGFVPAKKTGGKGGGDALLAAMKGQIFESPRGPMFIDAQTRDVVQNVYIRKVEKKDGQLYNVEFDVIKDVKDPGKS